MFIYEKSAPNCFTNEAIDLIAAINICHLSFSRFYKRVMIKTHWWELYA